MSASKNLTYFSPCSAEKKKDFNDWISVSSEAREAMGQSREVMWKEVTTSFPAPFRLPSLLPRNSC